MNIGFIGLGVMGEPMAGHLVDAGHDVVVFNRSRAKVDALEARGAVGGTSPAHVGEKADVVITMLPDSPEVEEVLFGDAGVVSTLRPGSLVIDCSTISPDAAVAIAGRLAEHDIAFVDAPVSGGDVGAKAGTLAVMMGGDADAVRRASEVLTAVAATLMHVGPAGSGQLVKAANQMLVAGNLALVGEAVTLLQRTGVDIDAALAVLGGGLAASKVLEVKAPKMLARDFTPGFRLDLHHKDLKIALAAAERAQIAVPLTGVITQLVQALRSAGDGGLDHSALIKALERLSGSSPDGR
ncbi:NAD(P)-dependent oxidoreductase [Mycolicibacterium vaccae]|jgi:2-hydroxy-3-oxopropionate reductase|uniref:6-phosphogluconate dehydrogenase n=1 Tax=Mycolicibacterium vaccae ATCC 25954 TaxID=1194972 RepID=K0V9E6_MYCVA|nr:NAD(P)-dependent oxidoreductase [Mycolicibacterium vaccae]EJZ11443.1 6-phosphogluconate dehydrogenase [Mycolicibacterium vaccae ATCC 25954]MCV7064213.1 NAD(P)-dependent oxidoreductase [Mycolicibacterium vaccae]